MEQLELDLGDKPAVPDTVVFDLVLPIDEGTCDRYAVGYESAIQLKNQLVEWLDFVEGQAHGR